MAISIREELVRLTAQERLKSEMKNFKEPDLIEMANEIIIDATDQDRSFLLKHGFDVVDNEKKAKSILDRKKTITDDYHKSLEALQSGDMDVFISPDAIENVCIRYGLRYLDVKHYNAQLPSDLPQVMREFMDRHPFHTKFKIIAPASYFELMERPPAPISADPILIAEGNIFGGNANHKKPCIVHKWGDEHINLLRKIVYVPLAYRRGMNISIAMIVLFAVGLYFWVNAVPNLPYVNDGYDLQAYIMPVFLTLIVYGMVLAPLLGVYGYIQDEYVKNRFRPFK